MSARTVALRATGVLGELLITAGVLLGLFVVWQLWWTDVVGARNQAALISSLEWVTPVTPDVPRVTPEPELPPAEAPILPEPGHGETFAILHVPRWGADHQAPISQGVSKADILDVLGIGHYPGTAMPGQIGNFALAGHRTTYGKPFHRAAELEVGDPLVVRTEDHWFVYRVTESFVVLPHQVEVIAPAPGRPGEEPTMAMLTITTCHPMFSARERFIVHSELEQWLPVSEGAPAALDEVPPEE